MAAVTWPFPTSVKEHSNALAGVFRVAAMISASEAGLELNASLKWAAKSAHFSSGVVAATSFRYNVGGRPSVFLFEFTNDQKFFGFFRRSCCVLITYRLYRVRLHPL